MKKLERKFMGEPTSYASPAMRFVAMAMQEHILEVSGNDINNAGEEDDDIFGN